VTVKVGCWHEDKQLAPHIPKTSAGRFAADVPITDRRSTTGVPGVPVSRFVVENVWFGCKVCSKWRRLAAATGEQTAAEIGPFLECRFVPVGQICKAVMPLAIHRTRRAYYS
jgi:hypothetical protein